MDSKEKVVVIGGGFAGINFVKRIDKKRYDVTLVDRNNFHSFPPLFYQVAASGLEPASISFPFRREIRKMNPPAIYHMGEVKSIDVAARKVMTQYETLHYDRLVIATGTTNNFFNMTDLYKRVFTIKSTGEAIRCRNEILDRLERASICRDEELRRRLLSFTVIGGGPTGVEVAGALGEMKRYILHREYKSIPPEQLVITLVEGSDRLLHTMSETASRFALKYLKELSVNVVLRQSMKSYDDSVLTFADGSTLYSEMVIWTAGVTGEPLSVENGTIELGHGNRILVDAFNRAVGHDDIFALGDIALHCDDMYPRGCPQLAQVAIQQARNLAKISTAAIWSVSLSTVIKARWLRSGATGRLPTCGIFNLPDLSRGLYGCLYTLSRCLACATSSSYSPTGCGLTSPIRHPCGCCSIPVAIPSANTANNHLTSYTGKCFF